MIQNTDRFTIDKRFTNRLRWVHIKSLNWTLGKRANLYVTPYHYHCWKDNIGTKLFWSRHASMNKKAFLSLKRGHKTVQMKNIWLKSWKWRKICLGTLTSFTLHVLKEWVIWKSFLVTARWSLFLLQKAFQN